MAPRGDGAMMARQQNLRHPAARPFRGPGVVRIFQQTVRKAFLGGTFGRAHHTRQQTDDGIQQDQRSGFATRQNVIAEADFFHLARVDHALVDAFVTAAQQDHAVAAGESAPRPPARNAGRAASGTASAVHRRRRSLPHRPHPAAAPCPRRRRTAYRQRNDAGRWRSREFGWFPVTRCHFPKPSRRGNGRAGPGNISGNRVRMEARQVMRRAPSCRGDSRRHHRIRHRDASGRCLGGQKDRSPGVRPQRVVVPDRWHPGFPTPRSRPAARPSGGRPGYRHPARTRP